jgi:redox-sensitive bicupin YhaK (pirin superfamily)
VSTADADVAVGGASVKNAGLRTGDGGELTDARLARVGGTQVRRLLPLRQRRTVGAWCFVDHYGPAAVDGAGGMDVPPHPHIGLQTVTWLLSGNVLHRDSLGSEQLIRPGQLNLMTAGRGIAHAEESARGREADPRNLPAHSPDLHGVQLWVALPEADRRVVPAFEHHGGLPVIGAGGLAVTVFLGSLAGAASPATVFSEIVGAEIAAGPELAGPGATGRVVTGQLPVHPRHEHVMFVSSGSAQVAGTVLATGQLLYLAPGREQIAVEAPEGSRLFLLGGVPLGEELLMWWNFVARTPAEIRAAAADWAAGAFGPVPGAHGGPMTAPSLDGLRLRRPAHG